VRLKVSPAAKDVIPCKNKLPPTFNIVAIFLKLFVVVAGRPRLKVVWAITTLCERCFWCFSLLIAVGVNFSLKVLLPIVCTFCVCHHRWDRQHRCRWFVCHFFYMLCARAPSMLVSLPHNGVIWTKRGFQNNYIVFARVLSHLYTQPLTLMQVA